MLVRAFAGNRRPEPVFLPALLPQKSMPVLFGEAAHKNEPEKTRTSRFKGDDLVDACAKIPILEPIGALDAANKNVSVEFSPVATALRPEPR